MGVALAVLPAGGREESAATLSRDVYTEGSILIPATHQFVERAEAFLVVDIVGSIRLDEIRRREPEMGALFERPATDGIVLLSEKFWFQLDRDLRMRTDPLGQFELKGFEDRERIFRWLPR